jgi:6-phosphofructokinase 1
MIECMKRFGILTGGGDAPGLNGIIEAVSMTLLRAGFEIVGICDGFEGIFDRRHKFITAHDVVGLHAQAGTFLGTSNKSRVEGREAEFMERFRELSLEGLIVGGGDGTFAALSSLGADFPLIGVPKTIDNDLSGTDITFGFDTACSVVAQAVDALRATAEAHRRIMVVEAMGRTAGWIALGGGLASYADAILIPERPFEKHALLDYVRAKQKEKRRGLVLVASESATAVNETPEVAFRVKDAVQQERFGGVALKLSRWLEAETGWESRHVVLGHLQRSASPTTTDRFLTLSMGVEAARMAIEGAWGQAVAYREGRVTRVPLAALQGPARRVPPDHRWVKHAQAVGLFI